MGMYELVIAVGFLTAATGLVCALASLPPGNQREVPALWAIVAALGVLQMCFGAIGNTLASLVQRKLPPRPPMVRTKLPPPIPENDEPLEADADLFDKPDDERRRSEF